MMNAIIKPIFLGVGAYAVSAVIIWYLLAFAFMSHENIGQWLLPGITVLPLMIAGYIGAKYTISNYRSRKLMFGAIAGIIGFTLGMFVISAKGDVAFILISYLVAVCFALLGGFIATR